MKARKHTRGIAPPRPRIGAALVILLAVLALTEHVCEAAGDAPRIYDAVCDGDGVTWGIVVYENNGLYRFEHGQWKAASVVGIPGNQCRPLRLTRRADGSAVCLWEDTESRRLFSVHRGEESKVVATVTLSVGSNGVAGSHLFADSKNNVWFTSNGPDICRFSPDGKAETLHVITPEESRGGGTSANSRFRSGFWNSIGAFEDAKGKLWFYTAGGAVSGVNMRGVLSFDGKDFVPHDCAPTEKTSLPYLGQIAPKDPDHLWVSGHEGLYTLDTTTFALAPLAGQPDAARLQPEIFHEGADSYFVFSWGGLGAASSLWRLRDGQWEKLLEPVDAYAFRGISRHRIWKRVADGIFVGSSGNGLWFLPDEGAPTQIDWKRGFPLRDPTRLVALPGLHRWLCINGEGSTWVGDLQWLASNAPAVPSARLTFVPTDRELTPDRRRHLWGVFSYQATTLSEWNGEKWVSHDLPAEAVHSGWIRSLLGIGEDQRVWLSVPTHEKDGTLIYDPQQDRWQVYADFRSALEAQAAAGPSAEPPRSANMYDLARFGPNGQICYLTRHSKIAWFDGTKWQEWSTPEISGAKTGYYLEGPPFFSATGRLRINLSKQTFERSEAGNWVKVPDYEPGYADNGVRAVSHPLPETPAGAVTNKPDSIAVDNEGTSWLTWHQQLYRCRDGLSAPMFQPGEAQPFIDGRQLTSVFIDARGNAVLHTNDYLILAPLKPPPHTLLELAANPAVAKDRVVIQLSSDAGVVEGKERFSWRLDEGAWQALSTDTTPASVVLDGLPGGSHRFEARSFDAALQTDATPAVLGFEVRVDPEVQIAGYIAQLGDADFSRRRAAVETLARQPERAFPALQAARLKVADESQRWWIDAALQQIERTKQAGTGNPGESPSSDRK